MVWKALEGSGGFGRFWDVFRRFGEVLAASVRLCKALDALKVFPGKGLGPGFSLSGRPSALDRTLFERGRRIFCMHFYRVS